MSILFCLNSQKIPNIPEITETNSLIQALEHRKTTEVRGIKKQGTENNQRNVIVIYTQTIFKPNHHRSSPFEHA